MTAGQRLLRLWRFTLAVFPPQVYVVYAVLWELALEGSTALLGHHPPDWRPSGGTAVRVFSVVLMLFYLRIVDEQKDLEYDREHNPDRPLVRGEISHRELTDAMIAIVIALLALNAWLSPAALAVLVLDLGYALFLVTLERRSPRIRDGLLLNLLITYPVQLLLSVYVYLSAADQNGSSAGWRAVPLLAIFVCVFMHFEFARKTAWDFSAGARLYSGALGPVRSARLAAGFAVAALLLTLALFPPWHASGAGLIWALLPYAALAFPVLGLLRFLRRRVRTWPVPLAMGFVVTSYLTLTIQAGVH
jgi:hypothetical protein